MGLLFLDVEIYRNSKLSIKYSISSADYYSDKVNCPRARHEAIWGSEFMDTHS
jgi:hypothetical protein